MPDVDDIVLRLRTPRRQVSRYLLAVGIVAVATAIRALVDPFVHNQIPYFVYVASVVVATWFCGVDGGILSTVLAAFAGNYFFVSPRYEFVPHAEDWIAMSLFASVALGLVWLVGRWRRAEREQRDLRNEAERMNRLKDHFLATLSHELRTPLSAILGWAHILDAGQIDAARRTQGVRTILRNAHAQARLIDDILDVSRIIGGKMQVVRAPLDLAAVVSSALDAIRPAALSKGIDVHLDVPSRSMVLGDADRLQQVVWNILSNAVKFTPERGRVDVRLEERRSHVVLTVADSGVGIARDFIPHLFERFRQADSSTTRQHGGLGLGLAVVRHLVELHGGAVSAESPGPGLGATFVVTLPVPADVRAGAGPAHSGWTTPSLSAAAGPRLIGVRVLVVDDEADARELVRAGLGELGADVRAASSSGEALAVMASWHPDVLVADIGMPGEDGYGLIRRVRALSREDLNGVPAIALTAYAQLEDRARAIHEGFQEHLAKPVVPHDLALVVETLAARKSPIVH